MTRTLAPLHARASSVMVRADVPQPVRGTAGSAGTTMHDGAAEDEKAKTRTAKPETAPLKLETFLPYRLNVVASLVSQALSRIYSERYGIGVPEWRVLVTLGQYGTMTGKAVGAHSHMHKTKVSRAVALLEKRKFVARRANRADMREAFLSLTPTGRGIYEELAPGALDFAKHLTEAIDPSDRAAFNRAIDSLTKRAATLAPGIPQEDNGD
jgi:DNA-binding MarR family transcriptional regulator